LASAYLENSFGIFSGKYLFTKLVAAHATNHTPNVRASLEKVEQYTVDGIEENIHLDYKGGGSISKTGKI
jgi:hypothetical protein